MMSLLLQNAVEEITKQLMVIYGNIKRVDMKEITKGIKDYLLSVGYPDEEKIFYLEVWLWLWREKKIHLNTNTQRKGIVCIYWDDTIIHEIKDMRITDPEEAIIAGVECLVDNDLIK